jgi:DNA polymerase alpha subunit B
MWYSSMESHEERWLIARRLDGMIQTPRPGGLNGVNGSTGKRRSNFNTPASKANKSHEMSSPGSVLTPKVESNGGT